MILVISMIARETVGIVHSACKWLPTQYARRHTENAQQKICTRKFNHKRYVRQTNSRTYERAYKCESERTIYFCMRYIGKEKVFYVPYIGCIGFCYDDK